MLEQEIASAMRFIIDKSGNPTPLYHKVPQDFLVPAVYFPQPEIDSSGDTLSTYALEYAWYVLFFHKDTQSAHASGFTALTALKSAKNVIPLISGEGVPTGRGFRLKDPSLRPLEERSAAQLTLRWSSPRQYQADLAQKLMIYKMDMLIKGAYDGAISNIMGGNTDG